MKRRTFLHNTSIAGATGALTDIIATPNVYGERADMQTENRKSLAQSSSAPNGDRRTMMSI